MPDLPPPPVLEGTAEIDPDLWRRYTNAKDEWILIDDTMRGYEKLVREAAGNAKYLTVDGSKVAVRVIQDAIGVTFRKDFYQRTRKGSQMGADDAS